MAARRAQQGGQPQLPGHGVHGGDVAVRQRPGDGDRLAGGDLCAVTGITSKSLRALMTGLLGTAYTTNQASYDLARLTRNGIITRIPHRNLYALSMRQVEVSRLVHLLRNSFKYASKKDWAQIAKDLEPVYTAASESEALDHFAEFSQKWEKRYPAIIRLWENAWAEFVPFLRCDREIRTIICTTNAIESINARLRRAVNTRGHFPTEQAALKCLYLAIMSLDPTGQGRKRWTNRWKAEDLTDPWVPVMALAQRAGLAALAGEHVAIAGRCEVNAQLKVPRLVAGMVAGADSIDDMDLLRHGAMPALFGGIRAPSTLGSFLRSFSWGNARQAEKVSRELLAVMARRTPLLPGRDVVAFVDIDSMQKRVYGHKKQGAAFGHTKIQGKSLLVRGLNALAATISTPLAAPVIAATRLRGGNANSARGAASFAAESVSTARSTGCAGTLVVRAGLGVLLRGVHRAGAFFSVTVRMDPKVRAAIAAIPEAAVGGHAVCARVGKFSCSRVGRSWRGWARGLACRGPGGRSAAWLRGRQAAGGDFRFKMPGGVGGCVMTAWVPTC